MIEAFQQKIDLINNLHVSRIGCPKDASLDSLPVHHTNTIQQGY